MQLNQMSRHWLYICVDLPEHHQTHSENLWWQNTLVWNTDVGIAVRLKKKIIRIQNIDTLSDF